MGFFSRCIRPCTISSPVGSHERTVFEEIVQDGDRRLVASGKENFKEFIEASKNETLIDNIIKRFERGDVNALNVNQGFFADIRQMPNNLAEAQNMLSKMEASFNRLPAAEREKFDNSFDKYVHKVSSMDVDEFTDFFNLDKKVSKDENIIIDEELSAVE